MIDFQSKALRQRILSALILGPIALAVFWIGGVAFDLIVVIVASLALYEAFLLSQKMKYGGLVVFALAAYVLLSAYCFYTVRDVYGPVMTLLLVGMIWFSDIDAYFTGKILGGPKMAEHISPNKTWAGLAGAMFSPAVLGGVYVYYFSDPVWAVWGTLVGACVGLTAQAGDLLMSYIKRKAGVKDSSNLIPGHGGILDRIDGLLLVTPLFLLVLMFVPGVFAG